MKSGGRCQRKSHAFFSRNKIVQMEHEHSFLPKLKSSTKTLICCVIMKKALTHTKLYPFVHIVSITFDHIPRKSVHHSICLWGKKVFIFANNDWTSQDDKANLCKFCFYFAFAFNDFIQYVVTDAWTCVLSPCVIHYYRLSRLFLHDYGGISVVSSLYCLMCLESRLKLIDSGPKSGYNYIYSVYSNI